MAPVKFIACICPTAFVCYSSHSLQGVSPGSLRHWLRACVQNNGHVPQRNRNSTGPNRRNRKMKGFPPSLLKMLLLMAAFGLLRMSQGIWIANSLGLGAHLSGFVPRPSKGDVQ